MRPDLQDREWDKVLQQSATKGNQTWRLKYCKPHQTMPGSGPFLFRAGGTQAPCCDQACGVSDPLLWGWEGPGSGQAVPLSRPPFLSFSTSIRGLRLSIGIQSVVCYWMEFSGHLKEGHYQNEQIFTYGCSILSHDDP